MLVYNTENWVAVELIKWFLSTLTNPQVKKHTVLQGTGESTVCTEMEGDKQPTESSQ